jgi:hypothetical protein
MVKTLVEYPGAKKMDNCGVCHDGRKAVGIRDRQRCDACHLPRERAAR